MFRSLFTTALIAAMALPTAANASVGSLISDQFHVYSIDGIDYLGSDFEGVTGAGGNVTMKNFSVGLQDQDVEFSLYVGGLTTLTEGKVHHGGLESVGGVELLNVGIKGSILTGGDFKARGGFSSKGVRAAGSVTVTSSFNAGGRIEQGVSFAPTVDHTAMADHLRAVSDALRACPVTCVPELDNGRVLFEGQGHGLNVFEITTETLAAAWNIQIKGNADEVFIINVHGQTAKLGDARAELVGGVDSEKVLFNFVDATELELSRIDLRATILAPSADTHFHHSLLTGGLYVGNLRGNGQANLGHFIGGVCECPAAADLLPNKCGGHH